MQLVRSQTMDHYLPGVDTDLWQDLYRDHRKITEAVSFVSEPNGMWPYRTKNVQKELDQSRLVSNWAKRDPEDFETFVREEYSPAKLVKMFRLSRRLGMFSYRRQLNELHKIAQGKIPVTDDAEFDERVKSSPGLHFYMRIALPCMCVYRKFPLTVLRAAKRDCLNHESPSFEWIEKLKHAMFYVTRYLTKYPEGGFPSWILTCHAVWRTRIPWVFPWQFACSRCRDFGVWCDHQSDLGCSKFFRVEWDWPCWTFLRLRGSNWRVL